MSIHMDVLRSLFVLPPGNFIIQNHGRLVPCGPSPEGVAWLRTWRGEGNPDSTRRVYARGDCPFDIRHTVNAFFYGLLFYHSTMDYSPRLLTFGEHLPRTVDQLDDYNLCSPYYAQDFNVINRTTALQAEQFKDQLTCVNAVGVVYHPKIVPYRFIHVDEGLYAHHDIYERVRSLVGELIQQDPWIEKYRALVGVK